MAGLYLLAPLVASNGLVNAYMSYREIGINIHTLPVVTVGVGIDYGLYVAPPGRGSFLAWSRSDRYKSRRT